MEKKIFVYELGEWVYRAWGEIAGKEKHLLGFKDIVIEHPADPDYGDYSTNVAMVLHSKLKAKNETRLPAPKRSDGGQERKITAKKSKLLQTKTPVELAKLIVVELDKIINHKSKIINRIEVVAPGFINFWLSEDYLIDRANFILKEQDFFKEISKFGRGKTMVIDYSSPNIAKPFGIGHLRSTNIGQAIYNLYQILLDTPVYTGHENT